MIDASDGLRMLDAMDTPPLIPAQVSPAPAGARFNLPRGAWIAWGIYAGLSISMFLLRKGAMDPYRFGEMIGGIVAILVMPAAIALLVWRLGGRSSSAGNATFFVVFGLLVLGQISQFTQRASTTAELSQLKAEQQRLAEEQRVAQEQGKPFDPAKAQKVAELTSAKLGALAGNSSGRDRVVAEAGKAFVDEMLAIKKRYDEAVAALDVANFWNLAKFSPGEPAEARRATIKAFATANNELAGYQDNNGTMLQRVMLAHGANANEVQAAVVGYRKSAGARLGLLEKIRNTDAQLAQLMLEFTDFAESNRERRSL